MIGNLYNYVSNEIVGTVPLEFEFIIPIIVIIFCILIVYVVSKVFPLPGIPLIESKPVSNILKPPI